MRSLRLLLSAVGLVLTACVPTDTGGQGSLPPSDGPLTEIAAASGLDFHHFLGASGEYYFAEIAVVGCALIDFDNDGDLDVYLPQGTMLGDTSISESIFPIRVPSPPRNRLFRNEVIPGGALRFTDVTTSSGTGDSGYAMGVATGDYDNDGDVDMYITNFGPDVLLSNNGDGSFSDMTKQAQLGDPRWNASATFFDYDNDGFLDLFVTAYADFTLGSHKDCFNPDSGAREYCGPSAYPSVPARLYRNLGNGRFDDVSAETGIDAAYGHGLGVVSGDFDGNGWLDLYVANDGDANQLWMNDKGRFSDVALMGGAAYNEHGVAEAGMGIAAEDYDDDGDLDFFITHLDNETNTLLENLGGAIFEDVTARHAVGMPSLRYTGFGAGALDVDHDSDLDLFISNGAVSRVEEHAGDPYPYHQTNQLMINTGNGRFDDRSGESGRALSLSEVSRGVAVGDIDNDGDVDILVSNNNGPVRLLRNDLEQKEHWMLLRVWDEQRKRDALGARVRVTLGNGLVLTRFVRTDGSYLSARDPRVHVAWPAAVGLERVEIVTRDGTSRTVENIKPDTIQTLRVGPRDIEVTRP